MPSKRPAKVKRMLSAELPAEPPLSLEGGLPFCCCPVPPPDETVGVGLAVAEGVGPTVGVLAPSEGVGVGCGVAAQLQETVALLFCPLKVIVARAGQVTLAGILMTTLL